MSEETEVVFEYSNLADVDPNFTAIPADHYVLRIDKFERADIVYKKGKKVGLTESIHKMQLVVEDHPTVGGRRLFETFFPGDFSLRAFRRISDATGVTQNPGEPLTDWGVRVAEAKPRVRVAVRAADKGDGYGVQNSVDWREVQPV